MKKWDFNPVQAASFPVKEQKCSEKDMSFEADGSSISGSCSDEGSSSALMKEKIISPKKKCDDSPIRDRSSATDIQIQTLEVSVLCNIIFLH